MRPVAYRKTLSIALALLLIFDTDEIHLISSLLHTPCFLQVCCSGKVRGPRLTSWLALSRSTYCTSIFTDGVQNVTTRPVQHDLQCISPTQYLYIEIIYNHLQYFYSKVKSEHRSNVELPRGDPPSRQPQQAILSYPLSKP